MEMNVCPGCGAVYKPRAKDCASCGAIQSRFASTVVSTVAGSVAPMVVSVPPDRLILERIVATRQVANYIPSYPDPSAYSVDDFGSDFNDPYGASHIAPTTNYEDFAEVNFAPAGGDQLMESVGTKNNGNGNGSSTAPVDQQNEVVTKDQPSGEGPEPGKTMNNFAFVAAAPEASESNPFLSTPQAETIIEQPEAEPTPELVVAAAASQVAPADFFADEKPQTVAPAVESQPVESFEPEVSEAQPAIAQTVAPAVAAAAVAGALAGAAAAEIKEAVMAQTATAEKNSRPMVAAPSDFFSGKSKGPEQPRATAQAPTTAAAFDFFQSSSSEPSRPVKSDLSESQPSKNKGDGDDSDARSSFESLLSKSSKTGNNKKAEEDDDSTVLSTVKSEEKKKPKKPVVTDDEDEDEEDEKPVKPKKKAAKKVVAKDDDDDDEDDEEEDKDVEIPQRRSFSGSPGNLRKLETKKPVKVKKEEEEEDEDEKGNLRGKFAKGGGMFNVAGFPIGVKLVAISIGIVGMLLFAVFHIVAGLSGGGGQQAGNNPLSGLTTLIPDTPKVAGDWQMAVYDRGKTFMANIHLQQRGSQLYGRGIDGIGPFSLKGQLTTEQQGPVIFLQKQFVDSNNRPSGPSIYFKGPVSLDQVPLCAQGIWEFSQKSGSNFGYLNKAKVTKVSGQWKALLRHPIDVDPANAPAIAMGSDGKAPSAEQKPFNGIDFMLHNGIFVAIGFGAALIGASFSLFGPSGLINIWNKQQYIPSQFKAQHNKIRGTLSKPLKKGSLPLGQRVEWKWWFPMPWVIKDLSLPPDIRKVNPHVLILGQGGKGKSRLIAGMIAHDIESDDRAVVLVDSDGSLVDLITQWISAHARGREIAKRVVLIDPTYKNGSVAYNPLNLPDMGDLQTAAASIVDGFKAIYTEPPGSQSQWNAQTADILRNGILLLMANNKTLIDLPTLLNENDFRDVLLENVEKKKGQRIEFATLLDQWGRYKKLARTDQWITWVEPILNRVNPMLSNPRIRTILTKQDGDLDILDIITKKKILLVRIPQGDFGQDANLLGSLIVSGFKQAALTLSTTGGKNHNPVAMYLDNFDNFIEKNTIEAITSETKKFRIGLIGVTKSLQHLPEDFRNQLIINIGTLVTFALSKKDGDLLGPQMFPIDGRKVKHQTMSNLFNRVNTTPQFELVSDEEKLNIDKIVRQEERTFYCYRMGAEAGLFNLKSHPFDDIPENKVKSKLIDKMHLASIKRSESSDS